jgi:hypothetical protein
MIQRVWDWGRNQYEPNNPWMNWCIPLAGLGISLALVLVIPLLPWR